MNKAIRQLEERLQEADPGSLRHAALEAAKRFKSSWIELGRVLWTVWKEKAYRQWGYLTFEAYCAKEVHIRPATAKKLLHSYYFLEKEEPTTLQRLVREEIPSALPSPEAVNALRLLKNHQEVSPDHYQKVRHYVLEEGKEDAEVRRHVRQILQASQPDPEAAESARKKATLRRMVGTLKSLRVELSDQGGISKELLRQVDSLIKRVEQEL